MMLLPVLRLKILSSRTLLPMFMMSSGFGAVLPAADNEKGPPAYSPAALGWFALDVDD